MLHNGTPPSSLFRERERERDGRGAEKLPSSNMRECAMACGHMQGPHLFIPSPSMAHTVNQSINLCVCVCDENDRRNAKCHVLWVCYYPANEKPQCMEFPTHTPTRHPSPSLLLLYIITIIEKKKSLSPHRRLLQYSHGPLIKLI